jgi:hypothetical protein
MLPAITKAGYCTLFTAAAALATVGCANRSSTPAPTGSGGQGGSTAQIGTGGGGAGGQTSLDAGRGGASGTGGASAGTGGGGGAIAQIPIPLPLVVTNVFNNQGWFGDLAVMTFFTSGSTVLSQLQSAAGPCAARPPMALGNCLRVVYTPPPGLVQPDAGAGTYIGIFMLTTLTMSHPELSPPGVVGAANWGTEPGRVVAPGATKVSFWAASATDGLSVSFRAGTQDDPFTLPEQVETLTTTWTQYELSLAGPGYETHPIIGPFGWVLHDTSKPATFYLDGIVWE